MKTSLKDLSRQIVSIMKCHTNYEGINEIRILNDGGGTGTMVVVIKEHGKKVKSCAVSMHDPSCPALNLRADEYYDISDDGKEII